MTYFVIGICLFLLILVVYISAKPISMGIEARRNIKDNIKDDIEDTKNFIDNNNQQDNKNSIPDEIMKLNELKNKGLLTEEEYRKAKDKILN